MCERNRVQNIFRFSGTGNSHEQIARNREREIAATLERAKGEVGQTNTAQIKLRELEQEVTADDIWQLFSGTYLEPTAPLRYREHHLYEHGNIQGIRLAVDIDGKAHTLTGEGNGPINAAVHALQTAGISVQVRSYEERSMAPSGEGGNAQACAFMEIAGKNSGEYYGVGVDSNIVTASLKALLSGANRLASGQLRAPLNQAA